MKQDDSLTFLIIGIFVFVGIVITSILVYNNLKSKFENFDLPNDYNEHIQTVPTIKEQKEANDKFMKKYNEYNQEYSKEINKPYMWNPNNSLDSMKLEPCLAGKVEGRVTCNSAPLWWYPCDEYDPEKFRTIYYGDYFNPIYNYIGNAQEMYWDFKSVKETPQLN